MQVVITGAAGRLGKLLQRAWANGGPTGLQPIWCARGTDDPRYVNWDILSDSVPAIPKGGVILHLAGVLRGDSNALSANAIMAEKVCDAAKAAGVKHVFLASSAAVYGQGSDDFAEDHTPDPVSDYGHAKLAMEQRVLKWSQKSGSMGTGITCLRIGNIVGADALIGQSTVGQDINLDPVHAQTGGPLRSYIGPSNLASVLEKLLTKATQGEDLPKFLNIAAPDPVFMADLLIAAKLPFFYASSGRPIIPKVSLSTARLAGLMSMIAQDSVAMIADWRNLVARPA